MRRHRPGPATDVPAAVDARPSGADGVEERGAFAFARCDSCAWQGPGRRSRDRARKDLEAHLEEEPGHVEHAFVEDVPR